METRVFSASVAAFGIDGNRLENFNKGECVKNIYRIGMRVIFEPANVHRIAGTFVMDWTKFTSNTAAVCTAKA